MVEHLSHKRLLLSTRREKKIKLRRKNTHERIHSHRQWQKLQYQNSEQLRNKIRNKKNDWHTKHEYTIITSFLIIYVSNFFVSSLHKSCSLADMDEKFRLIVNIVY